MENMLKFLDCVIRKTRQKQLDAKTLGKKVPFARDLRKAEDARNTLRGLFYAYGDFEKQGEDFELPETK